MASIIPFGTITVGAGTVNFCSSTFFGSEIDVTNPPPVHAIYFQAINGMTGVISIKYATKVIATLMTPNATGPLPEHWIQVDSNNQNLIDIKQITLTGTNSGDKVSGYLTIC